MPKRSDAAGGCHFPTTHWSLVDRAGDDFSVEQREALNELLTGYWPVMRAHLVTRKGVDPNEADDLVQGFLKDRVLEGNLLSVADRTRGRFRSLLAKSLDHYVANQLRQRGAKKRQPDRAGSLENDQGDGKAATTSTPSRIVEAATARDTLTTVLERMRTECMCSGRDNLWNLFEVRIVSPILEGVEPVSYDDIVRRFDFTSCNQAQNALVTAKRMFSRLMRAVLAERGTPETEIDAEIYDLEQCLSIY